MNRLSIFLERYSEPSGASAVPPDSSSGVPGLNLSSEAGHLDSEFSVILYSRSKRLQI
jgi:hypothetical protein